MAINEGSSVSLSSSQLTRSVHSAMYNSLYRCERTQQERRFVEG